MSGAKSWFVELGDRVIFCGKIAASVVAMSTVLFPPAATYFKVEKMETEMQSMHLKLDEVLKAIHDLKPSKQW